MWTANSLITYRASGARAADYAARTLIQQQPVAPPPEVHVDLNGLADLIWRSLMDHLNDLGTAAWKSLTESAAEGLNNAAHEVWDATFGALGGVYGQLPPEWTYDNAVYRAIATDPLPVASGGATLAVVLLGVRTLFGSMVGRDHVLTHITARLIPAVFLTLAYPYLIARGIQVLNAAAGAVGMRAAVSTLVASPDPSRIVGDLPTMILWVLLVWFGLRLLIRVAYSLVRFVVALVFGPVALILWAIPQTEWITWFWLRELIGWGTTPLLVSVCLSVAVPMATGRSGFLAAAAFGIAGFMAAHDLVGVLGVSSSMGKPNLPISYLRNLASSDGRSWGGASIKPLSGTRMSVVADQYGYQ